MRKLVVILTLIAVLIASALNLSSAESSYETYLKEFSIQDETCFVQDAFFYENSQKELGLSAIYKCSKENSTEVLIPFDVNNKKPFSTSDEIEIFNIMFIRSSIKNGNIKPENYLPQTADTCSYFGEKLNSQATALSVETGEKFAPRQYKKEIAIIKNAGHITGLLDQFDIGVFVLSVTCKKISKPVEEALLKAGECYQLVKQIQDGTSHYGIINEISTCSLEAQSKLKALRDSPVQQVKSLLDILLSVLLLPFKLVLQVLNNEPLNPAIDPTPYQIVEQTYSRLASEGNYLKNVNASLQALYADERLILKSNTSAEMYYSLTNRYKLSQENISGAFGEFLMNKILTPNIYQEVARDKSQTIAIKLENMRLLINEGRYNSALDLGKNISLETEDLERYVKQNPPPKQSIDYITIFLGLGVILVIIYIAYKKISNL